MRLDDQAQALRICVQDSYAAPYVAPCAAPYACPYVATYAITVSVLDDERRVYIHGVLEVHLEVRPVFVHFAPLLLCAQIRAHLSQPRDTRTDEGASSIPPPLLLLLYNMHATIAFRRS